MRSDYVCLTDEFKHEWHCNRCMTSVFRHREEIKQFNNQPFWMQKINHNESFQYIMSVTSMFLSFQMVPEVMIIIVICRRSAHSY